MQLGLVLEHPGLRQRLRQLTLALPPDNDAVAVAQLLQGLEGGRGVPLDVVVGKGAPVLELLAAEDEPLLSDSFWML